MESTDSDNENIIETELLDSEETDDEYADISNTETENMDNDLVA